MLMTILLILLVLAIAGGGWGVSRYGVASWSPLGVLLVALLLLYPHRTAAGTASVALESPVRWLVRRHHLPAGGSPT